MSVKVEGFKGWQPLKTVLLAQSILGNKNEFDSSDYLGYPSHLSVD